MSHPVRVIVLGAIFGLHGLGGHHFAAAPPPDERVDLVLLNGTIHPGDSNHDKPVVRELAERLRADGVRVWFDEWEFRLD